ncbi:MAG: ROK family protein [bacterium]
MKTFNIKGRDGARPSRIHGKQLFLTNAGPASVPSAGMQHSGNTRVVPSLLRQINARRIMDLLWQEGPVSRAELVRRTHISAPTMSRLMENLERAGLVECDPELQRGSGRPAAIYRPARKGAQVIGVMVGIRVSHVTSTGLDGVLDPVRSVSFPTPHSYGNFLSTLSEQVALVRERVAAPCLGVGFSVPGLVLETDQRIALSPNLHFLDGCQPGMDLEQRVKVPVLLHQEEHGFCIAERMFGAARGVDNFAVVDICDGLGMAVVSGGRLVTGSRGFGGELGHMTIEPEGESCGCGNRGCLETVATDLSFARKVSKQAGRKVSVDAAVKAVCEGRWNASELMYETLDFLATGVGMIINVFNPELVLVHGSLFDARDSVLGTFCDKVRSHALRPSFEGCRIKRTTVDKRLGGVAALMDRL